MFLLTCERTVGFVHMCVICPHSLVEASVLGGERKGGFLLQHVFQFCVMFSTGWISLSFPKPTFRSWLCLLRFAYDCDNKSVQRFRPVLLVFNKTAVLFSSLDGHLSPSQVSHGCFLRLAYDCDDNCRMFNLTRHVILTSFLHRRSPPPALAALPRRPPPSPLADG